MKRPCSIWLAFLGLAGLWLLSSAVRAQPAASQPAPTVLLLEVRGAIGPATSDYIQRGLQRAEAGAVRLVVIEMDTPGGLDAATRDINKAILASAVPVATFVTPNGSRAASAGTYILYASHLAAMSPATNLGAATPVQIGGAPEPPGQPQEKPADPEPGEQQEQETAGKSTGGTAMERKTVNDAVAHIRGLAELRGRNADWAEQAVREAVSLTAEEAHKINVIDFIATDLQDLLTKANGRTVKVRNEEITLETAGLLVERYEPDWRTKLLATITDPNVAYFLLLIGIYGLIFEGYNPGAILPGVVGAICLLLAMFAFQVLPVNYAGLGLMLLGVILLIAEVFAPSFGTLGIGGIVAFVIGSIMLLDTDVPGFQVSRGLITGIGILASAGLLGIMLVMIRMRRRPVVSGREGMIGSTALATADFDSAGTVLAHGEMWQAVTSRPVRAGDRLAIRNIDGLTLEVEPLKPPSSPDK